MGGGVMFIDEAYSLGNSEKRDSFSKEAIDMINQYLSERKNEFMLIVAEYENMIDDKDLDSFFEKNYKEFEFFGGDIEKVISEIKYSQSFRTFNENIDNDEVIFKDLEDAFENFKDTKKKKKKKKKK